MLHGQQHYCCLTCLTLSLYSGFLTTSILTTTKSTTCESTFLTCTCSTHVYSNYVLSIRHAVIVHVYTCTCNAHFPICTTYIYTFLHTSLLVWCRCSERNYDPGRFHQRGTCIYTRIYVYVYINACVHVHVTIVVYMCKHECLYTHNRAVV